MIGRIFLPGIDMYTINQNDLKFKIFGAGYDQTLNDSGEGDKPSLWYGANGNSYSFKTRPHAKIPLEYSDTVSGQYWGVNVTNNIYECHTVIRLKDKYLGFDNGKGISIRRSVNEQGYMSYYIDEDWTKQEPLDGISIKTLISMGLLEAQNGSSVTLYKKEPLSDTYLTITLNYYTAGYISGLSGVYDGVVIDVVGASFSFKEPNMNPYGYTASVNALDMGICDLTLYDGSEGLGIITPGCSYVNNVYNELMSSIDRTWSNSKFFNKKSVWFEND